jgi:hypothetical protein
MKLDVASAVRSHLLLVRAMALPYPQRRDEYPKTLDRTLSTGWVLADYALPQYTNVQDKVFVGVAELRLARAALEAVNFKEAKGRWPNSIEELSGPSGAKAFEDPFAAAPLKLVRDKNGLVIYSVGPDGKDDGGAAYDADKKTGDLSWRL